MKKNLIVIALSFFMAISAIPQTAAGAFAATYAPQAEAASASSEAAVMTEDIRIFVHGEMLKLDVSPIVSEGRTLVPMRSIFEKLGYNVVWDAATRSVTAQTPEAGSNISLQVDSPYAAVGGLSIRLDVASKIIDGRVFVPLRFVGEASGNNVQWDGRLREISITSAEAEVDEPSNGQIPLADSPLSTESILGVWQFSEGDLVYYFLSAPYIEFSADGRVRENQFGISADWRLDADTLTVIVDNNMGIYRFTVDISGGALTMTDRDNDTVRYVRTDYETLPPVVFSISPDALTYRGLPSVPDFGSFAGASLQSRQVIDGVTVFMYAPTFDRHMIFYYIDLLFALSFEYAGAFYDENGAPIMSFSTGDVTVSFGLIRIPEASGAEFSFVVMVS